MPVTIPSDEDGALLDMEFQPGGDRRGIEESFSMADAVDVGTDVAHTIRKRPSSDRVPAREVGGRQLPKQRARSHIGAGEVSAFLTAQTIELERASWPETLAQKAGENRKTGDHAGAAVEIAALRHGIEMRSAGDEGKRGFCSGERRDEIGAGVALGREAGRAGGFLPASLVIFISTPNGGWPCFI